MLRREVADDHHYTAYLSVSTATEHKLGTRTSQMLRKEVQAWIEPERWTDSSRTGQ